MIEGFLQSYTEQGRGCGCPGDDLLDDQARYLLGVHRSLAPEEQALFVENLRKALAEAASGEDELLRAFAVTGMILGQAEALAFLDRCAPRVRTELEHRAQTLGHLWSAARSEAGSGADVARLLRAALEGGRPSRLLAHAPPEALAEAWRLEESVEGRTLLLHRLGDRSEQEKRCVAGFLEGVAQELLSALPGSGRTWRQWLTGWLRRSAAYDRLYLEFMRSLAALPNPVPRRDFLHRCAFHPSPVVARRAVRQLFLEAEASGSPASYRPALEHLARRGPRFLRDEAGYAVSLLAPPSRQELLQGLGEEVERKLGAWRWTDRLFGRRERRLRQIYHLEPLRLDRMELTMEPGLAPDCAACPDRCCKGPESRVSLRLEDVLRLREAGLEWGIETDKPAFTEEEKACFPHLSRLEEDRAYSWFPALRQKEDGTCVFYGADGRCSVYEHRPLLCRAFPYQLDLEQRRLKFSQRCPSRAIDPIAAQGMADAAVRNFNAKIRDLLLVHYKREELGDLDLARFLSLRQDPPE